MNKISTLLEKFWICKDNDKEEYYQVKRDIPQFQKFIREQLGWKLIHTEHLIKLEKVPAHAESFMGIQEFSEIRDYIYELIVKDYEDKMLETPVMNEFEKAISLRIIDSNWVEHMNAMEHLKEGIGLRGYGQTNPIQSYTMEGFELFDKMLMNIEETTSQFLLKAEVRQNTERVQTIKGNANDGKEKLKSKPKKSVKIGRNDPCPCGSGKKYKQCCGK